LIDEGIVFRVICVASISSPTTNVLANAEMAPYVALIIYSPVAKCVIKITSATIIYIRMIIPNKEIIVVYTTIRLDNTERILKCVKASDA
jgi:hypothetical protein